MGVARRVTESLGIVTTGAVVYLVGAAMLAGHQRLRTGNWPSPRTFSRRYLWIGGFLFISCLVSLYAAIGLATDRSQTLEVALVNYLWPVLTLVLAVPLLGRRASWLLFPGVALAMVGIAMVITQGRAFSLLSMAAHVRANPVPYGLALNAAVSWAFYSNLCRRWGSANKDGAVAMFTGTAGLLFLGVRCFIREPSVWTAPVICEAVVLAAMSSMGYALWDVGVRRGNFVFLSALSYFTPFLSTLASCFTLQLLPGPKLWLGCALLIAGAGLSRAAVRGDRAGP